MSDAGMNTGMTQRMAAGAAMQLGVRVLQANSMELNTLVRSELEKNPVLELESPEEFTPLPDSGTDASGDSADWSDAAGADSSKRDYWFNSLQEQPTLAAFLHEQAHLSGAGKETGRALSLLIDSLDPRGFFDEAPEDIAAREAIDPSTLQRALSILQDMEPSGAGARNLQDCLLIQLRQSGEEESIAARLIACCWEDVVQHRYDQAARTLGITTDAVSLALKRIAKLNPSPGDGFSASSNPVVSPDILVEQEQDGSYQVSLTNEYIPKLRLSDYYKDALSEHHDNAELRGYLKKAFREGRELIDAIAQRQGTILKVAILIVERQREYFDKGPSCLKPLSMVSLADALGVHASTISRAVAGKYLLCRWGLKELRSFFSSGMAAAGDDAEDISAASIREVIRGIIQDEDKRKPLSDAAIAKALEGRGLSVARRTVAKYREQMKILPASQRRGL